MLGELAVRVDLGQHLSDPRLAPEPEQRVGLRGVVRHVDRAEHQRVVLSACTAGPVGVPDHRSVGCVGDLVALGHVRPEDDVHPVRADMMQLAADAHPVAVPGQRGILLEPGEHVTRRGVRGGPLEDGQRLAAEHPAVGQVPPLEPGLGDQRHPGGDARSDDPVAGVHRLNHRLEPRRRRLGRHTWRALLSVVAEQVVHPTELGDQIIEP